MYCKNCGNQIADNISFCPNCGTNQSTIKLEANITSNNNENTINEIDSILGLDDYYVDEFKEIYKSKEIYKGKFNWMAFIFGFIWALIKGLYLSAVVSIVIGIFSGGVGFLIYAIIFGIRGNYIYYNNAVKNKQIPL